MSAREDLLILTVAAVRRIPIVAAALDDAVREAEAAGGENIIARDASATVRQVSRWAWGELAVHVIGERTMDRAAAFYNLLAVLGHDVTALHLGWRADAKSRLLEANAAELVRRAREGGAA